MIKPARLVAGFRAPTSEWGPGHRGVDYLVTDGAVVLAPTAGIITFAGRVAEKSVVSMRIGRLLASFEPACATVLVGSHVTAGQVIALVCPAGYSSHCAPRLCLHFSARNSNGYLSPQLLMAQLEPSYLVR